LPNERIYLSDSGRIFRKCRERSLRSQRTFLDGLGEFTLKKLSHDAQYCRNSPLPRPLVEVAARESLVCYVLLKIMCAAILLAYITTGMDAK
jgi:hypothetical protein